MKNIPLSSLPLLLLLLVVASASRCSAAAPGLLSLAAWQLVETEKGFVLKHVGRELPPIPLHLDGGRPELLASQVAQSDPRIGLLIYHSGSAGTSQFYSFTRAIVIDLEKKKFLGIVLNSIRPESNEPTLRQPEWAWSPNQLTVHDREYGGSTTVKW